MLAHVLLRARASEVQNGAAIVQVFPAVLPALSPMRKRL
jgi:hypothetical protein